MQTHPHYRKTNTKSFFLMICQGQNPGPKRDKIVVYFFNLIFILLLYMTMLPISPCLLFLFGSYPFFKFYGSIVDFLCCVGFWCITKWINCFPMSPCTHHSDAWFQLCLALSSLKIDSSASSPLSYWHTALTLAFLERSFSCL